MPVIPPFPWRSMVPPEIEIKEAGLVSVMTCDGFEVTLMVPLGRTAVFELRVSGVVPSIVNVPFM